MITFKNGTSFEADAIFQGTGKYGDTERPFIEVRVNSDVISYDELNKIYEDEDALSEITITNANGEEVILTGYTIPEKLSETGSYVAVKDNTILIMKVAQKTRDEIDE